MLSSSCLNPSMQLSQYRRTFKNQRTHYIFNQQASDQQLSKLLDLLTQFNSFVQLRQIEKGKNLAELLERQIYKLDNRHRSYFKAKNLVNCAIGLVLVAEDQLSLAEPYIIQQQLLAKQLSSPEYLSKSYLLTLMHLHKKSLHKQSTAQDSQLQLQRQIKTTYKKFSKVKFPSNAQYQYYDFRLWEDLKIVEIVVYQFILIVQMLQQLCEFQADALYKCGLKIAKKVLGKEHKFVGLMTKITNLRKQTNKLIKMQPIYGSSIILSDSSTTRMRPKNLLYKQLQKMTNPQKCATISKKMHTEPDCIYTKSEYSKSEFVNDSLTRFRNTSKDKQKEKGLKSRHRSKFDMYLNNGPHWKAKNLKSNSSAKIKNVEQAKEKEKDNGLLLQKKKQRKVVDQFDIKARLENNLHKILDKKLANKVESNVYLPKIEENLAYRSKTKNQQKKKQDIKEFKQENDNISKPLMSFIRENEVEIEVQPISKIQGRGEQQNQNDMSCQLI